MRVHACVCVTEREREREREKEKEKERKRERERERILDYIYSCAQQTHASKHQHTNCIENKI